MFFAYDLPNQLASDNFPLSIESGNKFLRPSEWMGSLTAAFALPLPRIRDSDGEVMHHSTENTQ